MPKIIARMKITKRQTLKNDLLYTKKDITKDKDWDTKWLEPKEASKQFEVCNSTLRNWANRGYINCCKMGQNGKRRYCKNSIKRYIESKRKICHRKCVVYLRISAVENAQKKIDVMKKTYEEKYPNHLIYTDIESSNNWDRKNFNKIMESAVLGDIKEIIVTDPKNLWRHGHNFFVRMLNIFNVKLIVDNGKYIKDLTKSTS